MTENNKKVFFLLILILMCFTAMNMLWNIKSPERYLEHLQSINYFTGVIETARGVENFGYSRLFKGYDYAPLYTSLTFLIFKLTGFSYNLTLAILNSVFYIITALFIFLLTAYLSYPAYAVIAVLSYSLFPMAYEYMHLYVIDNAVASFSVMSIYFLVRSEFFRIRKWTLLLGMSIGLGLMTKNSFIAFLIGPVIFAVMNLLKEGHKKNRMLWISAAFMITLIIIFPHYSQKKAIIKFIADPMEETESTWYQPANLELYTLGIINEQLSVLFIIPLFIFGVTYLYKRIREKTTLILLLWFLGPFIILVFMPHSASTTYMLPYLPFYSILISLGMNESDKRIGSVYKYIFLPLAIVMFFDINFSKESLIAEKVFRYKVKQKYLSNNNRLYYSLHQIVSAKKKKHALLLPSMDPFMHPVIIEVTSFFIKGADNIEGQEPFFFINTYNETGTFDRLLQYEYLVYAGTNNPFEAEYFEQEIINCIKLELKNHPMRDVRKLDETKIDFKKIKNEWKKLMAKYELKKKIFIHENVFVFVFKRIRNY